MPSAACVTLSMRRTYEGRLRKKDGLSFFRRIRQ
jgi:hypothetical protein